MSAQSYSRRSSAGPFDVGVLIAAGFAVVFSLARYYSYDATGARKVRCGAICPLYNSAWHGYFGWFGVLLIVIGALAVATAAWAPTVRLPLPARTIALGCVGLGLVSTVAAFFLIPAGDYLGFPVPSDAPGVVAGHGLCYWLVLASAGAALAMVALGSKSAAR
ncbi:MAG: hypothetical protein ABI368_12210 [Jatrophihabitantaceae bacterium]